MIYKGEACHLSTSALAAECRKEISNYRHGDRSSDLYSIELLHRATVQNNQNARVLLQRCFSEIVHDWLRLHPSREIACRLHNEENYVAQAFERLWQATTEQKLQFNTLSAALSYLHVSLNAALLDALRAYSRPQEVTSPELGEPGEASMEDTTSSDEMWELLQHILPSRREQRLAYLLFHCGLKPREIVRYCPQEFDDVRDIYHLRHNMMERLLRNANYSHCQLAALCVPSPS
jgi:DNA-directed RNA polymerase specialized sigma24 family protein